MLKFSPKIRLGMLINVMLIKKTCTVCKFCWAVGWGISNGYKQKYKA